MKIRTLLVAVAAMISLSLFAGCASTTPKPLTPQKIAAIACPQLNLVHSQFVAFNAALEANPATAVTGAKASASLAAVQPIIAAVCNGAAAAPSVDISSIQALIQTGLPTLGALAGSLPLPPAQEAQVQAALVLAETAAGVVGVVEQQIKAAQAVPASASSSSKS
jgi:hypothetical protein